MKNGTGKLIGIIPQGHKKSSGEILCYKLRWQRAMSSVCLWLIGRGLSPISITKAQWWRSKCNLEDIENDCCDQDRS